MPYLGQRPSKGDENNFKILDDISSYTLTFDGSDASVVSAANDTITSLNHRFVQGQRVTYNKGGGSVIAGLSDGVYYIIKHDHHTIKLATSASNATNGIAVNITNVGSGSSHTLNVAFDGINTKFKATHTNGQKAKITRSAQLVISVNGVIQQPHDSATPSTGFGFDLDGTIVLSQAPVAGDVYWAHVLTNNNVTFDISDNDVDNFTGNGSTVSFNLSKTPPDNRNVLVTIDGVVQYPNDPNGTVRAYTVVENVLTFTVAPAADVQIQVRHIGFAGSTSGGGGSGVTNFYGRTGSVTLIDTDNITVNDAAITGNATVTGDLTVNGTTTTLDTVLTEVDKLEVAANNSTVGAAITQSGSGDILNLYDGSTEVFSVADGGNVTSTGDLTISSILPRITLNDTNNESDFDIKNENGSFRIRDLDNPTDRYRINSSGGTIHEFFGTANFSSSVTVTSGNITASDGGVLINGAGGAVLYLNDSDDNPDYQVQNIGGAFAIKDSTNNVERLHIKSNGRVGVGTDDIQTDLQVGLSGELSAGDINRRFVGIKMANDIGVIRSTFYSGKSGGYAPLQIHVRDGVAMHIDADTNRNIGIGTTNPNKKLHVVHSDYQVARFESTNANADGSYVELYANSTSPADNDISGVINFKGNNDASPAQETSYAQIRGYLGDVTDGTEDGYLTFHTRNGGNFGERLRITSTGSVGIGTNNPNVGNTAYPVVQVHGTSTNAYFKLTNTTTGVGSGDGVELSLSGSDAYLTNRESADIIFRTGGSQRLRITSGGGLQFRNADVPNNNTEPALILNHAGGWQFYASSDASTHNNIIFGTNSVSAGERLRITSDGNVNIGGDYTQTSYVTSITNTANTNLFRIKTANEGDYDLRFNIQNGESHMWHYGTDDFVIGNRYGRKLHFITNAQKRLTIHGDFVGINTATPNTYLHVKGTGRLLRLETTASGGGQCYIDFNDETTARASIGLRGSSSDTLTMAALNGQLRFDVSGLNEALVMDTSGHLRLGNSDVQITSNTNDGSDNKRILLSGGGASGQTRGAQIALHGNEYGGNGGTLQLLTGNTNSSHNMIQMYTDGNERLVLQRGGVLSQRMGSNARLNHGILEITSSATPSQLKIITAIPYSGAGGSHAESVTIRGFRYGGRDTVDLQICWHVYAGQFYHRIASSSGAWAPLITLGVENNKVVIHFDSLGYWHKIYVADYYSAFNSYAYASGWTYDFSAISGDSGTPVNTVPYKNDWGGLEYNSDHGVGTNPDRHLKIVNGNLQIGTSGHGIDFSVTGNSAGTMSNELLDDYEEGSWTPTFPNGSGGDQGRGGTNATYTKIGNMVYAFLYMHVTGSAPNNSTLWQIGGLPFAANSAGGLTHHGFGNVSYTANKNYTVWRPLVTTNSRIYFHRVDGSSATLNNSDVRSIGMTYFIIGVQYLTDS